MKWMKYRKKGYTEMHRYNPNDVYSKEFWDKVSISQADKENGSPKEGDMIARNPNNPNDFWLVSCEYFEQNYELMDE